MNKNVEISLEYPFLYKWKQRDGISILTNFYDDSFASSLLSAQEKDLEKLFKESKGNFAVVMDNNDFVFAAVDRIRSFPLFYKVESGKVSITDHLPRQGEKYSTDPSAIPFFIENSCTEGNKTLLKDWKQLRPGEYFLYNKQNNEYSTRRYFAFEPLKPTKHLDVTEMKKIYLKTVSDILSQIGDRPIIIMLSGGYDSRSILSVLTELKASNVFTYTYGVQDSFEKSIAEKIAAKLNLNWQFIEYTDELLKEFFGDSWKELSSKNHNFSSLPGEQDFFAFTYLKSKNLLPENGVVLSGFLGDCLGGSMFKNDFITKNKLAYQDEHMANFACKYIVNTVRTYEYFGLEWRQVLMTPSILEAWFHIPLKERCFENGYNNFLRDTFFKPLDIDFLKPDHYYRPQYLKNYLKKYLPKAIVKSIQKRKVLNTTDINNVGFLSDQITKQLGKAGIYKDINRIHAEYFLKNLNPDNTRRQVID